MKYWGILGYQDPPSNYLPDLFVIGRSSGPREYSVDVHHWDITKRKWNFLSPVPEALGFIKNNAEHPAPR